MWEIDSAITKITNHISKQEARQAEKPQEDRLNYLNALSRAQCDLLKLKETHRNILTLIL